MINNIYRIFWIIWRLNVASLEDKNWHQVCHTWSSKTSAWSIYMDGIQKKTGNYQFRATSGFKISFPRSGSSIGSNKFLLSQVNVWNRIFTSDEIKTLSKKCDAGTGNLASWADMYVRNKKAMFSEPSKCKPKPGAITLLFKAICEHKYNRIVTCQKQSSKMPIFGHFCLLRIVVVTFMRDVNC